MGGGDLNMKKSWHPLLMKNQERVWLEEKKALEEKKKLDQLRKEKEEERQLQELQRMQEMQTGKKKTEKLDWMYAAPAVGNPSNPNDLEDYLLGKKRVDKILIGDENQKIGASHSDFIAVQNANTVRDVQAKIREDPLFAIKQQEQAAYQALLKNPLRLKELKERNGIKDKKKDKKAKKRKGKERERDGERSRSRERHRIRDHQSRSRSRTPPRRHRDRSTTQSPDRRRRSASPDRRDYRDRVRPRHSFPTDRRDRQWPNSDETSSEERYRRDTSPPRQRSYNNGRDYDSGRRRSRSPPPKRVRRTPPPPRSSEPSRTGYTNNPEERAARLAAMSANASSMTVDRKERLAVLLEQEKAEMAAEERARAKSRGMGSFLSTEQKKVFGGVGGLEERIRRGRGGMVADAD